MNESSVGTSKVTVVTLEPSAGVVVVVFAGFCSVRKRMTSSTRGGVYNGEHSNLKTSVSHIMSNQAGRLLASTREMKIGPVWGREHGWRGL